MPEIDTKIVDGSVVVNMRPLKASPTFGDYAAPVFIIYYNTRSNFCRHPHA